ncbi:MAG: hypothetical protein JW889_13135 [Verrucomicrobia bacterium]|nr:hypothetical protein [Verrucomicrobiota bacterium]
MRECLLLRLPRTALLFAVLAVGLGGCGHPDPDAEGPEPAMLSVEETARVMIEALKSGDVDTFLAHTDLYGVYMQFPEPMRRTFSFQYFKGLVEKAKAKVGDAELNEFADLDYEILGVEERDGQHVVQFKTQGGPGKKWKLFEAFFAQVDGEWKLSGRGLRRIRPPEYP